MSAFFIVRPRPEYGDVPQPAWILDIVTRCALHYLPLDPIGSGGRGGHAKTWTDAWKLKRALEFVFGLEYVIELRFRPRSVGFVNCYADMLRRTLT